MCGGPWDEHIDIFRGSLLCPAQSPQTWRAALAKRENAPCSVPVPPRGVTDYGWALVQALHTRGI